MVSYKDKIITFPLFNTCYPKNPARNLARFFAKAIIDLTIWKKLSYSTSRRIPKQYDICRYKNYVSF